MITQNQTFAYDIRDAMYNVVTADPYFAGWTFRKTRMLPVQTDLVPFLGIYLVDETMIPDGDANAGYIRFSHTSRIGFSVVHANNDQTILEQKLDQGYLKIMSLLWTDIKLMNVLNNNNPENVGIESALRGSRRHIFGATGANNEFPFGELQYEVSLFSRSEWYPDIIDTLDEIDVTVAVNNVDTTQTQPVDIKYMFTALRQALIREKLGHG
jgi:hypothetical protein